ncbi:hypothetical protein H920_06609 [Fukomys damarensis]|uniref:Uncharacterized protein n=1 Tax=Fukomys damarensis TaxID=885580 RepID=A0A091DP22_FUKDA|nr:hypothetical protein H920_06609 [Fukomys damarensis]
MALQLISTLASVRCDDVLFTLVCLMAPHKESSEEMKEKEEEEKEKGEGNERMVWISVEERDLTFLKSESFLPDDNERLPRRFVSSCPQMCSESTMHEGEFKHSRAARGDSSPVHRAAPPNNKCHPAVEKCVSGAKALAAGLPRQEPV